MSSELRAVLRKLKPHKHKQQLRRRREEYLPFAPPELIAGSALLLDTTVYIDSVQGRLPPEVERILQLRLIGHSSIAIAELGIGLGRLDPANPSTPRARASIEKLIESVPAHRLSPPGHRAALQAGIATGIVARLNQYAKSDQRRLFNDALLFFQAIEQGLCLLSRNIADLDYLQQVVPAGQLLLYRRL